MAMNLSLDEYIRRKKASDSVCLLNMRKKEEYIDKDELDRNLDDMVREKSEGKQEVISSLSKFDRIRINSERCGEVDDDDDVIMENPSIRFAKEIEKMEHPSCCKSKPFRTIEEKMKLKITSQQWRLNKDDQGNVRQIRRVGGRIQKNYRQNEPSKLVDRGAFTFKYQTDSDSESSVVGITRNQPRFNGSRFNHNNGTGPIQINMNWRGFFEGVNQYKHNVSPPPPRAPPVTPTSADGMANVNLQLAARDLLEFLDYKKGLENKQKEENSFAEQYAKEARFDVSTNATQIPY